MSYDKTYSKSKDFFGDKPESILEKHNKLINRARPVLDIGAGQGRNSFFLAQNGIDVMAIDSSQVAVNTINEAARENKLSITAINDKSQNQQTRASAGHTISLFLKATR